MAASGSGSGRPERARRLIRRYYAEGDVSLAGLAAEYSRSTIHPILHRGQAGYHRDQSP